MAIFNQIAAHDRAIAIVTAGLTSGSIKLQGPATNPDPEITKRLAERDALYLTTLIAGIASQL